MPTIEADMLSLTVAHGGQSYPVELPSTCTVQELQARLQELTSVPIPGQKLIYKGKNLAAQCPTSPLSSLSIPSGARLLLVGSSSAAASAVAADHAALQRRYELSQTRQAVKPRTTAEGGRVVMDLNSLRSSRTFERFGEIEVLPGCPHEELRRERLRKLSTDEAVLACMKARDWQVGLLSELHPKRDPTLLGLNKNAGEAVYLRILTDELDGLRSYAHTRMVLLHELTHNKHGDHDEQFKTLNSLLNKEVKAYEEAQRAGSHRLGGDLVGAYDPEAAAEVEQMCGSGGGGHATTGQPSGRSSSSKPSRRNDEEQEDGAWEMEQRRRAMLAAAEARSRAGSAGNRPARR